ncbi:MAG: GntR family transcriptional regulator [Candidatus Nanopelagicales bacterium]
MPRVSNVASERVAGMLRQMILAGELTPGTRIRQEVLADQLGSSRLPVREALRMLESEGLTTLRANSGAWVSKLDLDECQALYKIRERVEPLVLRESIENLTENDCNELDRLQTEIEYVTDVESFLVLDRTFHLLTYSACPIELMTSMVTRFWNTTQHYRRAYLNITGQRRQWVVNAEHRLLIDALRRRDATDAERVLNGHIRRTRVELEHHPELFSPADVLADDYPEPRRSY